MLINGRERLFEYNVKAHTELSKICRDNDISNLAELMDNPLSVTQTIIKMACILNKGFEDHRSYDNPNYTPVYLTENDFDFVKMSDIKELEKELMESMQDGKKTDVEAEEPKKKERKKEEA